MRAKRVEDLLYDFKRVNEDELGYVKLYIRYLKTKKLSEKEIETEVRNMLSTYSYCYVPSDWDCYIVREIKKKVNLIETKEIGFTLEELESIRALDDINLEKVAFLYMYFCKAELKINLSKIFTLATFKYRNSTIYGIRDIQREQAMTKLNDINLISKSNNKAELTFTVKDEKEIYLHYLKWRDSNLVITCCECGRLVEVNSKTNKAKYCKLCSQRIKNGQKAKSKKNKKVNITNE